MYDSIIWLSDYEYSVASCLWFFFHAWAAKTATRLDLRRSCRLSHAASYISVSEHIRPRCCAPVCVLVLPRNSSRRDFLGDSQMNLNMRGINMPSSFRPLHDAIHGTSLPGALAPLRSTPGSPRHRMACSCFCSRR